MRHVIVAPDLASPLGVKFDFHWEMLVLDGAHLMSVAI
jgi:hypothetical protein